MDFKQIKNWTINGVEVVKITFDGVVVWAKNRLLKSITGSSVQDGVPTSSAPVPVVSVGDRTANLIDANATKYGQNIYVGTTTGLEEASTSYYCTDFIPVQAGKTYTHTPTGLSAHWFYNADKEPTAKVSVPSASSSVTAPDNCYYMRFNVRNVAPPNRLMCNEGEELLDFEPYGYKIPVTVDGTTTTIYTGEPLRKVGEYADEITPSGIIRRVIEWELDGVRAAHKITYMGVSGTINRGILANLKNTIKNLKPLSTKRSVVASNQYTYADVGNALATSFINNSEGIGQLYIVHTDQTLADADSLNARLAIERPIFYIPIEDTVDDNFTWADDINVPVGATITFDTTVQPSNYSFL